MTHTILITGAAGYVGEMLVERFAKRDDVERVIALDKEPIPEAFCTEPKVVYLRTNTADDWEDKVRAYHPDILIHAAWQIRELYGAEDMGWRWNIEGSDKVFAYAAHEDSVRRLVHFSTVASYGACPDNRTEHRFTEEEPLRQSEYQYAEEKRIAEAHLEEAYANRGNTFLSVAVVRPAGITGPRGRFGHVRWGLQSVLSKLPFIPVTPSWLRQFVHEDDVVNIIEKLACDETKRAYEVFNLCPPGPVVRGTDLASALGKRPLEVPPWIVRWTFFACWHVTRGRIPTGRGAWKSYSYPIAVDGSKVTRELAYEYQHGSLDAFRYTDGAYEALVPEPLRFHKA